MTRQLEGHTDAVTAEVAGRPGEVEEVQLAVEDEAGNRTVRSTDTYVRAYDVMEAVETDVSGVYLPFSGDKFGRCLTGATPAVGRYGDPIAPDVTDRHIDQMQGHGVTTVAFNFGESAADYRRWRAFEEASLSRAVDVECYYVLSQALQRQRDLEADLEFVRDNLFGHERYSRVGRRPVVQCWGVGFLAWGGNEASRRVQQRLLDAHGSYTAFVAHVRSALTVDGVDPFLVGEFRNQGLGGVDEPYVELFSQFDAGSTWTGVLEPGETVPWEASLERTRENFEHLRRFTDEHDMAFIPTVYPGFDDRHNSCWGGGRHVPRSPAHLDQLLRLADEYRSMAKVNLATFNGWSEGHQVEPGSFRGEDYGTAYLESVASYQNAV